MIREGFTSEAGPFTPIGLGVLDSPVYVPDFTASPVVGTGVEVLAIIKTSYIAAQRASQTMSVCKCACVVIYRMKQQHHC